MLRFIFDGEINKDEEEDMRVVGTEVVSDFAVHTAVREEIIRADFPQPLDSFALKAWAYMRRE